MQISDIAGNCKHDTTHDYILLMLEFENVRRRHRHYKCWRYVEYKSRRQSGSSSSLKCIVARNLVLLKRVPSLCGVTWHWRVGRLVRNWEETDRQWCFIRQTMKSHQTLRWVEHMLTASLFTDGVSILPVWLCSSRSVF